MSVGGHRHDPVTLTPGKTRYPLYRRLGGPRGSLDAYGKSRLHQDSIAGPSSPLRVAKLTELPRPHDEGTQTNMYSGRNLNLKQSNVRNITSHGAALFVCIVTS